MSKDRALLAEIIKAWAQSHTIGYTIADKEPGDLGVSNTGAFFTWLVQETGCHVDLVSLLDKLEAHVENIRRRKGMDGMFCCKCGQFYDFAEANQEDGSMVCYSCRQNPYK